MVWLWHNSASDNNYSYSVVVPSFYSVMSSFIEEDDDVMPTLKVSWRAKKTDDSNGGYSQEILKEMFSKVCNNNWRNWYILVPNVCYIISHWVLLLFSQFGGVHHVLVSRKKKGRAIVSFVTNIAAVSFINIYNGLVWHLFILPASLRCKRWRVGVG